MKNCLNICSSLSSLLVLQWNVTGISHTLVNVQEPKRISNENVDKPDESVILN